MSEQKGLKAPALLAVRVMQALDMLAARARQAGALLSVLACCQGTVGTHSACCQDNAGPSGVHRDVVDGITMPQALLQQHQKCVAMGCDDDHIQKPPQDLSWRSASKQPVACSKLLPSSQARP